MDNSINDEVEALVLQLMLCEGSREYVKAAADEEAVTGALCLDDPLAAIVVQKRAREQGPKLVANASLSTIICALHVSRTERRRATLRCIQGGRS